MEGDQEVTVLVDEHERAIEGLDPLPL